MKKTLRKDLRSEFFGYATYILPLIVMLMLFLQLSLEKEYLTIVFIVANFVNIIGSVLISIIAYKNRIKAVLFLTMQITRFIMLMGSFFFLEFILLKKYDVCFLLIITCALCGFSFLISFIYQMINCKKIEEKYLKSKKIDLVKYHFKILAPIEFSEKDIFYINLSAVATPVVVFILPRLIKTMAIKKILVFLSAVLILSIIAYVVAHLVVLLLKILQIQREKKVTFTTEYRDIVETDK